METVTFKNKKEFTSFQYENMVFIPGRKTTKILFPLTMNRKKGEMWKVPSENLVH